MSKKKRNRIEIEMEEKFAKIVNQLLPNIDNYEEIDFIFEFDDKQEKLDSGLDEIISFWSLPNIYGKIIKYKDVLQSLVKNNRTPLWIKISLRFEKQVILQISKRFRGERIIKDFHGDNKLQPFILTNSSKDLIEQTLERLFSRRQLLDYEILFLMEQQLNIEQIRKILSKNFEKTRFYPNKFLIFSTVIASYKGLVIEKNDDSSYSIHEQIRDKNGELLMLPDKKFENQEDAINEYIKFFPEIFDLEIVKN